VARFGGGDGVDGIFTASTPNQRQIIPQGDQPYPAQTEVAAAPVDGSHSSSVTRGALAPVSTTPVSSEPIRTASVSLDDTTTGAVSQPAMAIEEGDPKGWSRAGGTQVTVKEGETVYNLSRRFGVPADVIMKANGFSESDGLKAGAKIVIPTYVYSTKAPVSAPDNNPKTAKAKSSRGENLPVDPAKKPGETVAVLPQPPKLKEGEAAAQATTADGSHTKPAGTPGTYKVQEGDTLSRIARKTGVGVAAIKQANGLDDGLIRIGQTLKIPSSGDTKIAAAAPADPVVTGTASSATTIKAEKVAAYTPPKKAEKVIEQAEEDGSAAPDATGIGRMRWPVRGRVISQYGGSNGKSSDGIDISVPEGTPVKAAENGVVIYAGDGLKEFGNTVLVRHENGLVTVYGHASELKVARGEKVKRGQEIAVSGMSGTTDAPKLHFEVRKNSAPVDPSTYLE
jgi:murein DD-endopeptidase MepM/ murein hydrolase activator NlpD